VAGFEDLGSERSSDYIHLAVSSKVIQRDPGLSRYYDPEERTLQDQADIGSRHHKSDCDGQPRCNDRQLHSFRPRLFLKVKVKVEVRQDVEVS